MSTTAMPLPANRVRSGFVKTTRDDVTVYRVQHESYRDDGDPVKRGMDDVFHVATHTETKKLKGKNVEAVLFTIGGGEWFWMPKNEFTQSTEPYDIRQQTGIPHQL